jgi:membrane protease YdiL (CAAX protease family)
LTARPPNVREDTFEPLILATPEVPFWGFGEIFISFAAFLLALGAVVSAASQILHDKARRGVWAVAEQFTAYLILFAVLKIIFFFHRRPLLRSLAWVPQPFSVRALAGSGLALVLVSVGLQIILRTPETNTPFQTLLNSDPLSRFVIAIFGMTIAPVIEELLFRGFLQPVLVSATGVFPGILITSCVFGAVHLSQNAGIWQSGILIAFAGFVFGVVRHVSGSTRASSIVHIGYNSLPLCLVLLQGTHPQK